MTEKPYQKTRWGWWKVLAKGGGFKVKILHINSGKDLSLQYHEHRAEAWAVVQGSGELFIDNTLMFIGVGDSLAIRKGAHHKVTNVGEDALVIVETQIGDICEESDIVRLEPIEEEPTNDGNITE